MVDRQSFSAINRVFPLKRFVEKKPSSNVVIVNVSETQYPVVSFASDLMGWATTEDYHEKWNVFWTDSGQQVAKHIRRMKLYQRINHFPGMINIYRKNCLTRTIHRMAKIDSMEYNFYPKTWIVPHHYNEVKQYLSSNTFGGEATMNRIVIVKPSGGAQGKGIFLTMSSNMIRQNQDCVVQEYIANPYLIDGYKFDLRVYCLVVSCDPLRILVYKDGLVRFCTTRYVPPDTSNIDCSYMHLTNYAINKNNENYVENNNDDQNCSKRSLLWLWEWLASEGKNSVIVWKAIVDVIVKTLVATQAHLKRNYNSSKLGENDSPLTCFEVLGFDIMLTDELQPILVEVNHTPSFRTDSMLDLHVKRGLIENTLKILNVSVTEKESYESYCVQASSIRLHGLEQGKLLHRTKRHDLWKNYLENERRNRGNFDLVYPADEYSTQPTFGRQAIYHRLLLQSAYCYEQNTLSISSYQMYTSDSLYLPMPPRQMSSRSKSKSSQTNGGRRLLIEPPKSSASLVDNPMLDALEIQFQQLEELSQCYISPRNQENDEGMISTKILDALESAGVYIADHE